MSYEEGFLEYSDGSKVRYWLNNDLERPLVVFVHGLGENLEIYRFLWPLFDEAGLAINSVELRGHGQSSGKPKFVKDFGLFAQDLKRFLDEKLDNRPVILMGHSTGGMVISRVAQDLTGQIQGIVLSSPLFALKISTVEKIAISILSKVKSGHVLPASEEDFGGLTHDPGMTVELLNESKRTLMGVTMGFLGAFRQEKKRLVKNKRKLITFPLLLFLAGKDSILDVPQIEEMVEGFYHDNKANLELVKKEEAFHAIFLETDRYETFQTALEWIIMKLELET